MTKIGWLTRLPNQRPFGAMIQNIAGGIAVAALFMMPGHAVAQAATPQDPMPAPGAQMSVPDGYSIHEAVDLGGRMANTTGSSAMYDTLVNLQSGPRVQGETFELRALPGNKHGLVDGLKAFSSGFGGDPNEYAKMDFYKGKLYEFSGMFHRDRQYFDYNLLGNPNIPGGLSTPVSGSSTPLPWSQVKQSPFLFNTVRHMTDTNLTILPLSKVTYRFGYAQNVMQGPSITPSGYQVGEGSGEGFDVLLKEFQRHSTDDFTGSVEWKVLPQTRLTFEEEVNHFKDDSYLTLDPAYLNVQEPDGTRVALAATYDSLTPYTSASCNATSMGGTPVLSAASTPNGLPIINPACWVMSSYYRAQPTRILYPTEMFRMQSSSIKNVTMNGDVRYTQANMNMPNYYENFQGLVAADRSFVYQGSATAKRQAIAADYGVIWQISKKFSFADQISYSSVHQPGSADMTSETIGSVAKTAPNETINNPTVTLTSSANNTASLSGSPDINQPLPGYFGQKFMTNNATASWDATDRTTISFTYRYQQHVIAEGFPHTAKLLVADPVCAGNAKGTPTCAVGGTVTINQNGGVLNVAVRPTNDWTLNGSAELLYADNAFTPMTPRQTQHYRVHTTFKPKTWATFAGAYNDLERHNNTNNFGTTPANGPLNHVDHSRIASVSASLMPNEHYGLDLSYAYSDVYIATNICYDAAASATLPGAAPANGAGCPTATVRGTSYLEFAARDFSDAPTQSGSVAVAMSPNDKIHSNIGYRISAVNGTQFFNDARAVNGSLDSTYQSPFVNVAWTLRKGLIWKGEYNFFGYGEGGPSGSQYCATSNPTATSLTVPVVACSSLPETGMSVSPAGMTTARNFHANNVTLGLHYEF